MQKNKTPEELYKAAVDIADNICNEIKWAYVNYEVYKSSTRDEIKLKFADTYSGNVWVVLQRSLLNDFFLGVSKVCIDKTKNNSSFHELYKVLQNTEVIEIIKKEYSQAEDEFENRLQSLLGNIEELDDYLKTHQTFKALIRHRHNYLAHRAQKVQNHIENLKVQDAELFLDIVENIIHPMELILLNGGNISNSTRTSYRKLADSFWNCFDSEKESFSWS